MVLKRLHIAAGDRIADNMVGVHKGNHTAFAPTTCLIRTRNHPKWSFLEWADVRWLFADFISLIQSPFLGSIKGVSVGGNAMSCRVVVISNSLSRDAKNAQP